MTYRLHRIGASDEVLIIYLRTPARIFVLPTFLSKHFVYIRIILYYTV